MRIVNIHEAKTHLSRLVDKAAKGDLQPPIQRHRHHTFVILGRSRSEATSRRPSDPCRDIRRRMQRPRTTLPPAEDRTDREEWFEFFRGTGW
ncbi:MAG: type II toxin-antitoxin system Phd/YefM family antitoxin [Mesorhizobium sp.]|nr:MAG: type II toxin-antitoxin system Phd/YefM family antitoxin [Mesorhizobium sp.]